MSGDAVAAYQDSLGKLQAAEAEAERVVRVIRDAAQNLGQWKRTVVSNVDGHYPIHLTGRAGTPSINAHDWPSADALNRVLGEWHAATFAVRSAWSAIPPERRVGLTPPEPDPM